MDENQNGKNTNTQGAALAVPGAYNMSSEDKFLKRLTEEKEKASSNGQKFDIDEFIGRYYKDNIEKKTKNATGTQNIQASEKVKNIEKSEPILSENKNKEKEPSQYSILADKLENERKKIGKKLMKLRKKAKKREARGCQDEYEVGYGKPPKKYQFKKGQSGNSKGRPKKIEPNSIDDAFALSLLEPATFACKNGENEIKIKMPKYQAIVEATIRDGIKKDGYSRKFLLNYYVKRDLINSVSLLEESAAKAAVETPPEENQKIKQLLAEEHRNYKKAKMLDMYKDIDAQKKTMTPVEEREIEERIFRQLRKIREEEEAE